MPASERDQLDVQRIFEREIGGVALRASDARGSAGALGGTADPARLIHGLGPDRRLRRLCGSSATVMSGEQNILDLR